MSMPKSVLIVDDAAFIRMMIRDILANEGYAIHEAVNGRDALEKYSEARSDLVIMDIMMPEMNGLAALRAIRDRDPDARIVIVSAMTDRPVIDEALRRGAMAFVSKPFQPTRVRETVRTCLSSPPPGV